MPPCAGFSTEKGGVNELAINPFTEEDDEDKVVQEVKYGRLRVNEWQNLLQSLKH